MEPSPAIDLAAVAGGVAVALVALGARRTLLAGLAALAIAEISLALLLLADTEREALSAFLTQAYLVVPAVAALVALAVALARLPGLVPVALLAAAPFRVPIEVGGERVFLLLPLYCVLAAALAALAYRAAREKELARPPLLLAGPVALVTVLAAISMLWATDIRGAGIDLVFYYLPFAALFGVVARTTPAPWTRTGLVMTLLGLAVLFAIVGLVQVRTGSLPFAPDIEVANEYTAYTRVTSLFNDPSIYGRHLAVALAVSVCLLWLSRISIALAVPLFAFLYAGLFVSYSQSSMVALFVAVLGVSLVASESRARRLVGVAALAATILTVTAVAVVARGDTLREATSGRSDLVANTLSVIAAHPLMGVGIGGEEQASRAEGEKRDRIRKPSHTTPLTVAAELGAVGVAVYLLVLTATARALALLYRIDRALALALLATALVQVVHSLFYSGFFEDPITWGALGLAAAALAARPPQKRWADR